jgi:mono/diheme cytochrome c family protein
MIRMLKIFFPIAVLFLIVLGVFMFNGPEMDVQPNLRPFQAVLPAMPEGTEPVESLPGAVPTTQEAAGLSNPLPATPETLARGRTYYGYYCLACHGDSGDGAGPVGQSYDPPPADLRQPRLSGYSDGQLLRGMLTGIGHAPELRYVVPPEHRWYLVSYIRHLSASPAEPPAPGAGG